MSVTIATWNINSIRLRRGLVAQFLKDHAPDILCLQEIKCAKGQFPFGSFRGLGYDHISVNGGNGHHGVCTISRLPLSKIETWDFNNSGEARHLKTSFASSGQRSSEVELHNVYVPAGGEHPDVATNSKFAAKLAFYDEMASRFARLGDGTKSHRILVGDLNIAPMPQDVWSHDEMQHVVSHTPVEIERYEKAQAAHNWQDVMRRFVPDDEKLYTWWSYGAKDWLASNRGRRLDHVWATPEVADKATALHIHQDARGFERPSDHVPVVVNFDI